MWLPSQWLQKIADSKARVVKTQDLTDEAELVFGEGVRITTEGQRHCQRTSNNISRKGVFIQLEQLELLTLFT